MRGERELKFSLHVLLTKEIAACNAQYESGWVAECLEYDIGAQGETIDEAKTAFARSFVSQIMIDIAHNRKPLEGIGPSPEDVLRRYESAAQLREDNRIILPDRLPDALSSLSNQTVTQELRVA
jgi:hypothetical protein